MTSSSQPGVRYGASPQSKSGAVTRELPFDPVIAGAYGSVRHSWSPSAAVIMYLYSSPGFTPDTSADQYPLPSWCMGAPVTGQPLNEPVTETARAWGAQTRKVAPSSYGTDPIPGRWEGAGACESLITVSVRRAEDL